MKFSVISTVLAATFAASSLAATSDTADPGEVLRLDDYLVKTNPATFDQKAPAVTQQVLGSDLKELNLATKVGDLRNLPNLFIRERTFFAEIN